MNESSYQKLKTIQFYNGNFVREHHIGTRKKLYFDFKLLATTTQTRELPLGKLSNNQFTSFLGRFNKNLYSQFNKNRELITLRINHMGFARQKNYSVWDTIEVGERFYNLDLFSAYWQITHKLGYISSKLFNDFFENDTYKQAKRYAISFLARKNEMHYISENETIIISCDTSILKQVYDNIRNELYRCLRCSIEGIDDYLEYNIDGVYVKHKSVNDVLTRFKEMGLQCRIAECIKINESQFTMKGEPRFFRRLVTNNN